MKSSSHTADAIKVDTRHPASALGLDVGTVVHAEVGTQENGVQQNSGQQPVNRLVQPFPNLCAGTRSWRCSTGSAGVIRLQPIHKSTDAGKSRTHIGLDDTQHIGRVAVDPRNANIVFVVAIGHLYEKNPDRGASTASQNGGATWTKVLFKNDDVGAVDAVIDPTVFGHYRH